MQEQKVYRNQFSQRQFALDINDQHIVTSSFDLEQPNNLTLTRFSQQHYNPFQQLASTPIHFPPTSIKFLPQNPDLILTSSDCLRIYKYEYGHLNLIQSLKPDFRTQSPVLSISIPKNQPHLCAATSSDGLLALYDLSRNQPISITAVSEKSAQDVCEYLGNTFLVSSETGEIRIFDPRAPKSSQLIAQSGKPVVKVRTDCNNVFFLENDTNYINVTDIRFTSQIEQLKKHDKAVQSISLGENMFVTTGNDGRCYMWQKSNLKPVMCYICGIGCQNSAINGNFTYLLSGSQLECLRVDQ
ncbi:WD40 repeat protein [Spironucleus salmonicida]|uniref:WD40 repeat protein n=1 Tax=Spironucleus salmonicida TaxID=348837 RepID=V6M747_9EUKA|nr:WD40 repeat protein [Spironucleus salmonicida]|eukprot:EST49244.1 Hypothetical protein SS50377_10464 [Spironucleus salmonicida]